MLLILSLFVELSVSLTITNTTSPISIKSIFFSNSSYSNILEDIESGPFTYYINPKDNKKEKYLWLPCWAAINNTNDKIETFWVKSDIFNSKFIQYNGTDIASQLPLTLTNSTYNPITRTAHRDQVPVKWT